MTSGQGEDPGTAVAEIQGLYGAFSFPEKLLQKIWLRGNFDRTRLATGAGTPVQVGHPGKWNLLGGPDFLGARLRFGAERETEGDVELHLHARDWDAHGHAADPAYARVVLHVVLFPPEPGRRTIGAGGREIPVAALLPLLRHDLEEFAADEAVEGLADRAGARIPEELGRLPAGELGALLARQATERWAQKVRFAELRCARLGWAEACHQTALEILGYRFNRAPMVRVAARWPLAEWQNGAMPAAERAELAYASEAGAWSLQGVRPANRPRLRLRQYARWVEARPDWPGRWAQLGEAWAGRGDGDPPGETTIRGRRRELEIGNWRERIADEVMGGAVGGTRGETLICDGLLPLLAARAGAKTEIAAAARRRWEAWPPGDLPPLIARGLRELAVCDGKGCPVSHGAAQGLLGWLIDKTGIRRPETGEDGV
ncbi:MAG: hypothetical protein B9S34_05200 [Opitutia bacterium Tous-C1TDCM]|nr:MAG: hypothetical protein B9S34_05200 [Opitutae bacterium Tous-C1TDCM]